MKLIVVQTLDNQVLDKEIDNIDQIKKFLYLLEENNLQVKDDILYFIDYGVHKVSKVNINFIYDSKFIDIYKALKKKNYLKDYVLDYLSEYHADIEQEQVIPQQFNNFNQRVNSKYKYGSVFNEIKKQQFLEDGNIDKLYNIDPLPKKPYFIWLVEQYKSGKLLTEDFFKAEELLEQFSNKRLRSDLKKNGYPVKIEHYDSINDLFSAINSLDDSIDHNLDEKYALVLARKVAENNDWIISVPKTHEESVLISRYGGMTNWCTAADSRDGSDYFNNYTKNGESLFICIYKENPEEKYQLNNSKYGDFSFMDKDDNHINDCDSDSLIRLLHIPIIFNELYCEDSIIDNITGGIYKRQQPEIINGICPIYYKPKILEELNYIFSVCLIFEKDLNLNGLKIKELPHNLEIGGNLDLRSTHINKIPDNLKVGGNLDLDDSLVSEIGENVTIGGDLEMAGLKIRELPKNLNVGGSLNLRYTEITELPEDLKIGNSLSLSRTLIKQLPDGFSINENLNLMDGSKLTILPKNLNVGNMLLGQNGTISEISEGTIIGGSLLLQKSGIKHLPEGLIVGGNLMLFNTTIEYLPENLEVGRDLNIQKTKITKLPRGLKIGGNLLYDKKIITELPDDLQADIEKIKLLND